MADAIRQQLLNLLPMVVNGETQGVPWSSRQIESATGFDWETVKYTLWNLRKAGAVVNVGGSHPTQCLWAKTVARLSDGRVNNGGHRPRRLEQASRGMGVTQQAQVRLLPSRHTGQVSLGPSLTTTRGSLRSRNKTTNE
jgi:hypothetical protein